MRRAKAEVFRLVCSYSTLHEFKEVMAMNATLGWEGRISVACEIYKLGNSQFVLEFKDLVGEVYTLYVDPVLSRELEAMGPQFSLDGELCST